MDVRPPLSPPLTEVREPRMYSDLAPWWPLLSPPEEYVEEAAELLAALAPEPSGARPTLLELGAGGGSLAFHLKAHFTLTLTDLSPGMLAVSRAVNPECEHLEGDMMRLRLGRTFDRVLVHDAIDYAVDRAQARATVTTAVAHCRPGGRVVLVPDGVRESFEPDTSSGGHDAPDGRGLRYLSWSWDADPDDERYETVYSFICREADGSVKATHELHHGGLFRREDWLGWLREAGCTASSWRDSYGREVFLGIRDR